MYIRMYHSLAVYLCHFIGILFPVMIGAYVSGWDITLVDLHGPSVDDLETCVGPS